MCRANALALGGKNDQTIFANNNVNKRDLRIAARLLQKMA